MADKNLTLLGSKQTVYPTEYNPELLETFDNKNPEFDYWVRFNCPEFTSLCPITGQPDFAEKELRHRQFPQRVGRIADGDGSRRDVVTVLVLDIVDSREKAAVHRQRQRVFLREILLPVGTRLPNRRFLTEGACKNKKPTRAP